MVCRGLFHLSQFLADEASPRAELFAVANGLVKTHPRMFLYLEDDEDEEEDEEKRKKKAEAEGGQQMHDTVSS